jgi:hypothetical protein
MCFIWVRLETILSVTEPNPIRKRERKNENENGASPWQSRKKGSAEE